MGSGEAESSSNFPKGYLGKRQGFDHWSINMKKANLTGQQRNADPKHTKSISQTLVRMFTVYALKVATQTSSAATERSMEILKKSRIDPPYSI